MGSSAGGLPPGLTDFRLPFDEWGLRALNGLSSPLVDGLTRLLGRPLFDWVCAALLMLWIAVTLRRRAVVPLAFALAAVGVTDLIGARVLKPLVHRMRPFDALPRGTVHQAIQVSHLGSMPSLHAANAFALAVVLGRAAPRLAPILYGFAALIALSRVVAGVHWPSDVVAGALFGSRRSGLAAAALLQSLDDVAREAGASGAIGGTEQARHGRPALDDHRALVREGAESEDPVVAPEAAGTNAAEGQVGIGPVQEHVVDDRAARGGIGERLGDRAAGGRRRRAPAAFPAARSPNRPRRDRGSARLAGPGRRSRPP